MSRRPTETMTLSIATSSNAIRYVLISDLRLAHDKVWFVGAYCGKTYTINSRDVVGISMQHAGGFEDLSPALHDLIKMGSPTETANVLYAREGSANTAYREHEAGHSNHMPDPADRPDWMKKVG